MKVVIVGGDETRRTRLRELVERSGLVKHVVTAQLLEDVALTQSMPTPTPARAMMIDSAPVSKTAPTHLSTIIAASRGDVPVESATGAIGERSLTALEPTAIAVHRQREDGQSRTSNRRSKPSEAAATALLPEHAVLSPSERVVIRMLANGLSSKEIASSLFISPRTVEAHRQNISAKLGIRSIAGLTKYAIRTGLSSLDLQ